MANSTVLQSVFNKYDAEMQKMLTDKGFVVIPDPIEGEVITSEVVGDDLLGADEAASDESGIWLNIGLDVKGVNRRVAGTSLDFALYRSKEDREADKKDDFIQSIIKTIEKHGIELCNNKMVFTVTLSKQGESGIAADTDLLGDSLETTPVLLNGGDYAAYVKAGWTDAQLIAAGFLAAPVADTNIPLPPA